MHHALRTSTVDGIIRRSGHTFSDRVAVVFGEREWTYAALDHAVTRIAVRLVGLGLGKGDRVAAFGKNSDAYLIGFLACARAGLVHVPLNYNLTGSELSYLLRQSGAQAIMVDPGLEDALHDLDREVLDRVSDRIVPFRDKDGSMIAMLQDDKDAATAGVLDVEVSDADLCQFLYTSGTTSRPKAAMMSHRALVHEYVSCIIGLDLKPDDAPLHVMPLYHSAQMQVFLMPWLAVGATNTIREVPDPEDILRRIEGDGHRAFFAAPTLWVALTNHPDFDSRDLSGLRKAYYGASIMPVPIIKRLETKMPSLGFYNCFGQSEIAPLATILRPEEHADRPTSAGRPCLFVEARVIGADGHDVPVGDTGEIVYRSPQLCDGYWDNSEATEAAFADGWFHSGDLVRMDAEGYVYVVDRIKDVINTGGVLVASREIEDVLYTHEAVAEVAVVGVPDEKWIEAVVAFVICKGEVSEPDLIAHARNALAGFKVPKRVVFIEELPRNTSGKILKRELRELELPARSSQ